VFQYAGGKNCRHNWFIAIPIIEEFRNWRQNADLYFESYTDYPEVVKENAQRALNWVEKNGWGSCGTPVGKARANQLAKGEPISKDTISRMSAFARHLQYNDKELGDGCAKLMILAWGGKEGIEWAQRKLEQIKKEDFEKLNKDNDVDISTIKNKSSKMNKRTVKKVQRFEIEEKLEDGTEIIIDSPSEDIVVGAEVEIVVAQEGDVAEETMTEPAPDGSHTLEDGTVIVTEGGEIVEIKEEGEETTEVEAGKKKEKMEITEEDLVVIMEALAPKFEEIMGMIAELSSKVNSTEETSDEEVTSEENFNRAKEGLSAIDKLMVVKQKFNLK
jgi:hypothetical protein